MQLKCFNRAGLDAFRDALAICRDNPLAEIGSDLLESPELSEFANPAIEIEPQSFKTKREAAVYLHQKLCQFDKQKLLRDEGIWSWLSLYYFDVICPLFAGKRLVRADYTYVLDPSNLRYSTRHLLYVAWRILLVTPTHNRLFLDTSVSSIDTFTDKVMKNLQLTRIPCIFEVLEHIYWDQELGRSRKGVVHSTKITAGDITHRFPLRILQLEKTYDLQSLSANQLIDLLGDEFRFDSSSKQA